MEIKLLAVTATALIILSACQPPSAPPNNSQQTTSSNNCSCSPAVTLTRSAPQVASNGKTVAIDIGHDRVKFGAMSATGHSEFSFNLAFAQRLKTELERQGYKAFLINESGAQIRLAQRTKQAAKGNADILLSIHHDSAKEPDLVEWTYKGKKLNYTDKNKGFSLFVNKSNWENVKLAASIGRGFNAIGIAPSHYHKDSWNLINRDRGIYNRPSLAVLRTATMPTVLVEVGVIKNREEEQRLLNNRYKEKLVKAMVSGINEYLGN